MTQVKVGAVEVHPLAMHNGELAILTLERAPGTRCPGSWEVVHGMIEDDERPEDAAVRELREETGLAPERLYSVRVTPFYLLHIGTIELSVVFAAFVDRTSPITLDAEHTSARWRSSSDALDTLFWPGERTALREIIQLLSDGTAGPAEDVLRVR